MKSEPSTLYTLRIWSGKEPWRATLTDALTLEKQHFASVEALNVAIQAPINVLNPRVLNPKR